MTELPQAMEASVDPLGLLDALRQKAEQAQQEGMDRVAFDEHIIQQALGIVDEAIASPESQQLMNIIEDTGRFLMEIGCNHEHFLEMATSRVEGQQTYELAGGEHAGHVHESHAHTASSSRKKTKKPASRPTSTHPSSRHTKTLFPMGRTLFQLFLKK